MEETQTNKKQKSSTGESSKVEVSPELPIISSEPVHPFGNVCFPNSFIYSIELKRQPAGRCRKCNKKVQWKKIREHMNTCLSRGSNPEKHYVVLGEGRKKYWVVMLVPKSATAGEFQDLLLNDWGLDCCGHLSYLDGKFISTSTSRGLMGLFFENLISVEKDKADTALSKFFENKKSLGWVYDSEFPIGIHLLDEIDVEGRKRT